MKNLLILGLLATVVSIPLVKAEVPTEVRKQFNLESAPVKLTVYDLPVVDVYAFTSVEQPVIYITNQNVFVFDCMAAENPLGLVNNHRKNLLNVGYNLNYCAVKPPSSNRIRSLSSYSYKVDKLVTYRC